MCFNYIDLKDLIDAYIFAGKARCEKCYHREVEIREQCDPLRAHCIIFSPDEESGLGALARCHH